MQRPDRTVPAMAVSDPAQGTWVDRNGGFAGYGEPATTTAVTVDGTAYTITCDPTMAALKAIREIAGHARPRRGCQEGICGKCESVVDRRPRPACASRPSARSRARDHRHPRPSPQHLGLTPSNSPSTRRS